MTKNARKLGIYIHIPFCVSKCIYCDFYSTSCDEKTMERYTDALIAHIRLKKHEYKNAVVDTIFFGGGTPSIMPAKLIAKILAAVKSSFKVLRDAEISLEANPGTLDSMKLSAYKKMGINRLSIGLQSASEAELSMLRRIHTRDEFQSSYMLARMEGFDNINIDLIYALPRQTKNTFFENLNYALAMKPEHISLYCLTVADDTPLGKNTELLRLIPSDDDINDMYVAACKKLDEYGYHQYEISNFAKIKPGAKKAEHKISAENDSFICRHNVKYWTNAEYVGFGPSASSFVNDTSYTYVRNLNQYITCYKDEKGIREIDEDTVETEHTHTKDELEFRYLMTGFRLRAGINTAEYTRLFAQNFDKKYYSKLEKFIEMNYIVKTMHGYRLTRKGAMISNSILCEILDFKDDELDRFSCTNEVSIADLADLQKK